MQSASAIEESASNLWLLDDHGCVDTLPIARGHAWGLGAWMKGSKLGNITGQFEQLFSSLIRQGGWFAHLKGQDWGLMGVKGLNWTIVPTLTKQNTQLKGFDKYGGKRAREEYLDPILFNYFPSSNPRHDLSHGQGVF